MKNKKIISLICAIAMIFSMFSAITVNAADKGINIAAALSEDGKVITIDATSFGTEGNLNNFMLAFNVPEGVTLENVKADSSAALMDMNIADGILYVPFLSLSGSGTEFVDGKLATVTITLASPLAEDYVITMAPDTAIEDTVGFVDVLDGGMAAATATVEKWVDPSAPTPKPEAPARPTQAPTGEGDEPVPTDVPAGEKGIAISGSIDDTNTVVTIEATAVGTVGNLNNFMIAINVPEGVALENVKADSSAALMDMNIADGVLYVPFLSLSGSGTEFADGKIATLTITLPSALTAPFAFTLQPDAAIEDTVGFVDVLDGGMVAASTVVTPVTAGEEEPDVVKSIDLADYVADDAADAATAAEAEGKDVYVTVDVEKKDGTKAVYGEDFAAVYDGKVLTEAEFTNLISGYTDTPMADVISGLSFNIYDKDVNKVSTTVNAIDAEGNKEMIADPVEDTITSTPVKKPVLKVSGKTSAYVGDTVTLKPSVTNPVDGAVINVTVTGLEEGEYTVAADGAVTFEAAKTGTVKVKFDYVDGEDVLATKTVSVSVKKKSEGGSGTGGSSSDSSDSDSIGNGPIANGNNGATVDGTTPSTGIVNFTDLGSVDWAKEAITKMAMMGIVNGRDSSTFDPNANITRAEYCQILIGAIGKTNESADSSFDDVATNAWYYHSVSVASKYGIVSGYGDGNFGPNNLITRQDMALMTLKAAQVMNKNLAAKTSKTFADADQISDYAAEAVMTLANAGIINGMSDTEFAPKAYATRAQAAKILYDTFVK